MFCNIDRLVQWTGFKYGFTVKTIYENDNSLAAVEWTEF